MSKNMFTVFLVLNFIPDESSQVKAGYISVSPEEIITEYHEYVESLDMG